MTDRTATLGLSRKGQALPQWDPLLRLTHWGIAGIVLANFALTKEGGSTHVILGWTGLGLLILRLIWGVVGPEPARFSSFPPNPVGALSHLKTLIKGRPPHYPSHNPAGALMAYALWATLAVITATGIGMSGLSPTRQAELENAVAAGDWSVLVEEEDEAEGSFNRELLEEVHEMAANLILVLAFLHVAGVAVESRAMGRNLLAPMLIRWRGRK